MSKRNLRDRDLDANEGGRDSKRFKASPAPPPADSLLAELVAWLLEDIDELPPGLAFKGFARSLKSIVGEDFFSNPLSTNTTLRAIGAQMDVLTTKDVEAGDAVLVKGMMDRLNRLKNLLPAAHEAARKAREQAAMPPPSAFAQASVWAHAQENPDAILCLRPRNKKGLPLITLHEAFLYFVNESKKPLPKTEVAALKAAFQLCSTMGEPYEDEPSRRYAFNKALDPLISREAWFHDFGLGGAPGMSGWIGGALHGALAPFALLREDKTELGAEGDPYMQVSRGFQAFVAWKKSQNSYQGMPGVAKFLLTLAGPTLMISGGFYDGKSTIIEPLTPGMIMLLDHNMEGRPMPIAQCLFALKKAIDLIRIPPEQPVVAATPRIYSRVLSVEDPLAEIPISFVRPFPHLGPLMFLAIATVGNSTEDCLVKLVYRHYGTEVHRLLARDGLVPRLLGTQTIEGAPIAIAMEYLEPYYPGSEGWATLLAFAKNIVESDARSLALAVNEIVEKLEQANLVHGDLRINNLMVHVNADGTVLNGEKVRLKVIDFDWGGQSGEVNYPTYRNDQIWWPAGAAEDIVVGHDRLLVQHWWETTFPEQAYPPVG